MKNMPAIQADNVLALPRIVAPNGEAVIGRRVTTVVSAPKMLEGEGFEVRRAFASVDLRLVDPFIMLDHLGAVEYSPARPKVLPIIPIGDLRPLHT
jgi:hypothetical protein